ncbi:DUF4157 domain-containing protein [Sinorhizobium medicae]|nr:DUF4157 domain-containing protein [Sinorhizobium medicae]MDX1146536.1 DUF4157 domain-containing protein [Sinorhizobium medicae]
MASRAHAVAVIASFGFCMFPNGAFSCGAFDIGCEVREIVKAPGAKLGEGARNLESEWNKSRNDLSNGLNRIDPRISQAGRDIDAARLKFQSEVFTGPALEQWIIASRNDAINGAMPMPPEVRQVLQYWYPAHLLDLMRWKIGQGGELNVANLSVRYGEAEAITLIDVVIFRDEAAYLDLSTWVHEMKHIQQYYDYGVHSFAVQYMRSWNSIEDPAYAIQGQFTNTWNQVTAAAQGQQAQPSLKCYLSADNNNFCWLPPEAPGPFGAPCTCQDRSGAIRQGLVGN